MTTIDTLLTVPPRNLDDDTYRARIEAKRQRARRFYDLDRTATAALGKAMARPVEPTREPKERPILECVTCGQKTRPRRTTAAQYPGTRDRGTKGRCSACTQRDRRTERGAA